MPVHGITAKYQPFTFNDYMAPVVAYQERYDKMQEALASKYDEVGAWKGLVDPNSTAGKTITQYEELLNQTAQDLATNGLKAVSRNALFDLKRTYNSQIAPIKTAATSYLSIQDDIRKAKAKDDTLMVSDVPTIEDLMVNPSAYPTFQSGKSLMQDGATAALAMSGVTYEQLSRYLNGDLTAIPDLSKVIADVAKQRGVTTEEGLGYIQKGILAGMGERAAKEEAKQKEHELEMDRVKYVQRQENWRQTRSIERADAALKAEMARFGLVPDGTGGWKEDTDLIEAAERRSSRQSSSGTSKGPLQRVDSKDTANPRTDVQITPGTQAYNSNHQPVSTPLDGSQANKIDDIANATLEEKVMALQHANIPVDRYEAAGVPGGYVEDDIDRLIQENRHVLKEYAFFHKMKNGKLEMFWAKELKPADRRDADGSAERQASPVEGGTTQRSNAIPAEMTTK